MLNELINDEQIFIEENEINDDNNTNESINNFDIDKIHNRANGLKSRLFFTKIKTIICLFYFINESINFYFRFCYKNNFIYNMLHE